MNIPDLPFGCCSFAQNGLSVLCLSDLLLQFMAFRKTEALLKMAQFVLFKRNRVQTKSMAGNFYRASPSQGN